MRLDGLGCYIELFNRNQSFIATKNFHFLLNLNGDAPLKSNIKIKMMMMVIRQQRNKRWKKNLGGYKNV